MTCIVGIRAENGVVLAADGHGISGNVRHHRADRKVFNLSPEIAMGFTTSYRMGQILRWHIDLDPITGSMHRYDDLWDWVGKVFVPSAKAAMAAHGYAKTDSGRAEGGTFLLAVRDRLFQICDDFQVGESELLYDACGSGEQVALGALYADHRESNKPSTASVARLSAAAAIAAAAHHTTYIGGTISYAETTAP